MIFIVSLFLVLLSAIKEKNIKSIYVFLLLIALGITPYLGAIVKGQHILLREQFILPFVFAFLSAFLYHILSNMCIVKILLISALLVTSSCQTLTTLELFKTDYLRYRYDCTTVQEITETAIQNYGPLEDKIMVYSGFKTWAIPENMLHGDCIGYSILQWDAHTEWGTNYRINYFSKCLGLTSNIPTMEQIRNGQKLAKDLSPWPSSNSMTIDGNVIVIKLSE